jgi:hypothetical protein
MIRFFFGGLRPAEAEDPGADSESRSSFGPAPDRASDRASDGASDSDSGRRSSSVAPILVITQKKQFSVTLTTNLYRDGGRTRTHAAVSYAKFPGTLWAIGPGAPGSSEEDYTPRTFLFEGGAQRRVGEAWYAGPSVRAFHRKIVETEAGGAIERGEVPGTRAGWMMGAGATLSRDTRDVDTSPRRGAFHQLHAIVFDRLIGSDFELTELGLDLRQYLPLSRAVLGLRAATRVTVPGAPFDYLPSLGGENLLRGYYQGRYRDRTLLAAQAELRAPIWRRIGGVLFCDLGQVASHLDRMRRDRTRVSGGAGLRVLLSREERFHLRADYGVGSGTSGFYLGLGEAF